MKLTPAQQEMFLLIKEKGFIKFNDICLFYSTPILGKNAIERLISLGFLKEDKEMIGKFLWTGKDYKLIKIKDKK